MSETAKKENPQLKHKQSSQKHHRNHIKNKTLISRDLKYKLDSDDLLVLKNYKFEEEIGNGTFG